MYLPRHTDCCKHFALRCASVSKLKLVWRTLEQLLATASDQTLVHHNRSPTQQALNVQDSPLAIGADSVSIDTSPLRRATLIASNCCCHRLEFAVGDIWRGQYRLPYSGDSPSNCHKFMCQVKSCERRREVQ